MTATPLPHHTDTVDRYLETIYCIAGEGERVRPGRIADWLEVSAPTVSVALQRMARDGWIEIASNRSVSLTPAGEQAAATIVRRHRLLERWLTDVLGFDWATADIEADRLSAAVSDTVLTRLDESMSHPTTCPHGNAIPGRTPPYGNLINLNTLQPNVVGRVQRISEIAEHEARPLLRRLDDYGIHPGTDVTVSTAAEGVDDSLQVRVGVASPMALSATTAQFIWVELLSAGAPSAK